MLRSLFSFKISSRISMIPCGSRPFIGSSSSRKSGSPQSAIAIPSRCRIPSEKLRAFLCSVFSRPTSFSSSGIPLNDGIPRTLYCSLRLSSAVISRYIDGVSTTAPILLRAFEISPVLSVPYSVNVPEVANCKPQISLISVVLPAPFRPTNP